MFVEQDVDDANDSGGEGSRGQLPWQNELARKRMEQEANFLAELRARNGGPTNYNDQASLLALYISIRIMNLLAHMQLTIPFFPVQEIFDYMKEEQDLLSYNYDRESPADSELPEWEQSMKRWAKR